jgi:hypothetical protein
MEWLAEKGEVGLNRVAWHPVRNRVAGCGNRLNRRPWDRRFESGSLHRRVACEPDLLETERFVNAPGAAIVPGRPRRGTLPAWLYSE